MVTRLSGLSSGLDVDSWVTDLMKAERTKVDTQYQKKQTLEWKRDAYRSINTKLLALRSAALDLKLQSTFQGKTAESGNTSVLTVNAGSSAVAANYSITVDSLASGVTKSSSGKISTVSEASTLAAQFGITGAVNFSLEGKDGSHDFSFDTTTTSIDEVVSAINEADLGIKASYDSTSDRFYLMTTDAGSTAKINVTADAENFLATNLKLNIAAATGTDAQIDFNDAEDLTYSSNKITINGLTLNLKSKGTTTVSVSDNIEPAVTKIKAFVEAYNNAVDAMSTEMSAEHDRDYVPLTDAQKEEMSDKDIEQWETKAKTGLLRSDSILVSVYNSIRSMSYNTVDGVEGKYTSLSSVGITTASYSDKGKLYIDETKLRAALTADSEGVMDMFSQSPTTTGEKGLAVRLYDSVNTGMTKISSKAGSSSMLYDSSIIGKQLTDLSERIDDMEDRLTDIEERYYTKFTAMEQAIAKFNSQSSYLSSMFSSSSSS